VRNLRSRCGNQSWSRERGNRDKPKQHSHHDVAGLCVLRVNSCGQSGHSVRAQHTYTRAWMVFPPPSARVPPQRNAGSAAPAVCIAASPQCLPTTRGYARFSKARRRNHP
jgi:hypothetical protein